MTKERRSLTVVPKRHKPVRFDGTTNVVNAICTSTTTHRPVAIKGKGRASGCAHLREDGQSNSCCRESRQSAIGKRRRLSSGGLEGGALVSEPPDLRTQWQPDRRFDRTARITRCLRDVDSPSTPTTFPIVRSCRPSGSHCYLMESNIRRKAASS